MRFEETQLQPDLTLRKVDEAAMDLAFKTLDDRALKDLLGIRTATELGLEKEKHRKGLSTHNQSYVFFFLLLGKAKHNIGWCGFHTWHIDHNRAEIGYKIYDENNRRKGYMTAAFRHTLGYGFSEMNLNRIEAYVASYNTPSLKLLERCGFQYEGTLQQHYKVNDRHEDSELYALLHEDYSPK